MIRMFAKRTHFGTVGAGVDSVFLGMALPGGSKLHKVSAEVHLWTTAVSAISTAAVYACEGWIIPVHDPDTAKTYDTLWDQFVPKDDDTEDIDLDTASTDTSPFFEPGEPTFDAMFDVGLEPKKIFSRQRLLSPLSGALIVSRDPESTYLPEWMAGEKFNIDVSRGYYVNEPSIVMFAIGIPNMDDVVNTLDSIPLEQEWGQMKYIEHVLERALLHLFGVTEVGAETPWEEATALLKKHLLPDVYEVGAGKFLDQSYNVLCKGTFDHSVTGRIASGSVSLGRG